MDLGHPEFAGRILPGYDFVHDDADPADDHGHGTSCAGIALGAGGNAQGIAGVSWGPRLLPVKVLDRFGNGALHVIAEGITWAADRGVHVLSISIGSEITNQLLEDAVVYAYQAGCALFCAAGNSNRDGLEYPALYTSQTIPVGAMSPCEERKSPSSCDGETWWGSNYGQLAFLTPGTRMHSTDIRGSGGYDPGDYTDEFGGTSAATPHAAGIGALVLSLNPALSPGALENVLVRSAEDMYTLGYDAESGYGRLNAHLSVLSAFSFPIYVDHSNGGVEVGTLHLPYDTVAEGVNAISSGGTVVVFHGTYRETMTVTKAMTLIGKDGLVSIGP